ncbi:PKD domain-containing protein [Hungatella hathewayi]|uniref:PKD domain-containing protein n=1 Tax=Hungatella hathewayi TaxID=154046 RepID=UPI00356417EE
MNRLPECYELSVGEVITGAFDGDNLFTVRLIGVESYYEPFYQSGKWYDIFLKAKVDMEVNGVAASLWCKPYQTPVNVAGLNILVDLVKGVAGGLHKCHLDGDIRFSGRDANLPWISENYCFPIRDYKWKGSNYIHTWNGFVSIDSSTETIYYHRGEDFGAVPDRYQFAALDDSVMERVPGKMGDNGSNRIITRDDQYQYRYCHANAPFLEDLFYKGRRLQKGEGIKLTGNTWNGGPVLDPHLHIGIENFQETILINTFVPMLYAYKDSYPDELLVTTEGFRFCIEGDTIVLDASDTEKINECSGLEYRWELSDGTVVQGEKAEVCYKNPGTYTEKVVVRDEMGRRGVDHVIVSVFKETGSERPFCWLNAYPMRKIGVMEDVEFLVGYYNMNSAEIEFGDGTCLEVSSGHHYHHAYEAPGYYTVTVRGRGEGGSGVFKIEVIVDEEKCEE